MRNSGIGIIGFALALLAVNVFSGCEGIGANFEDGLSGGRKEEFSLPEWPFLFYDGARGNVYEPACFADNWRLEKTMLPEDDFYGEEEPVVEDSFPLEEISPVEETFCLAEEKSSFPVLRFWRVEVRRAGKVECFEIPPSQKTFSVRVKKNDLVSLLAYPVCAVSCEDNPTATSLVYDFFYPAGTIFPWEKELSWLQGWSSSVLADFYSHSRLSGNDWKTAQKYASRFNFHKFMKSLEEQEISAVEKQTSLENQSSLEGGGFNPWCLDKKQVLEAFEKGSFSLSLLKLRSIKRITTGEIFEKAGTFPKKLEDQTYALYSAYVPENTTLYDEETFQILQNGQFFYLLPSEEKIVSVTTVKGSVVIALNSLCKYTYNTKNNAFWSGSR